VRRTEFIDVEHRGFNLDDMAHVNDSLLAACVADDAVADAWERDAFEGMFVDEAQDAMASMWHDAQRSSLASLNRRLWALNIERTLS